VGANEAFQGPSRSSDGGEPPNYPTPDQKKVRSGQVPLQGAVRPCRWWRGLSNRSDARGDAGGSFALLAGSPMPARVERTGEKQRTAQPSGSTTEVVARELAIPGEIRATVWSNADQPSHTVTAAHTSTTLASVAGVRRVRTRGRGACLNWPAREETTSIKQPTAKSQKPAGHLAHLVV
jgi:hypothetical protein